MIILFRITPWLATNVTRKIVFYQAVTLLNGHCERSEAVSTRRHSPMVTALVFTNYYTFPTTGYFKPTTYAEWLGFKNNLYYLVAD